MQRGDSNRQNEEFWILHSTANTDGRFNWFASLLWTIEFPTIVTAWLFDIENEISFKVTDKAETELSGSEQQQKVVNIISK